MFYVDVLFVDASVNVLFEVASVDVLFVVVSVDVLFVVAYKDVGTWDNVANKSTSFVTSELES